MPDRLTSTKAASETDAGMFRQWLDHVPQPLFVFTQRLLYANRAMVELSGYSLDRLTTMTPAELVPEELRDISHSAWGSAPGRTDIELRRADGRLLPISIETTVLPGPEGPATLATIQETVDDRSTRTLRMLNKAFETTQLGVTITDTEGTILYSNRAEAEMHGYRPEELIGQDVRVLAPEALWKPLGMDELKQLRSRQRETVNRRRDGSQFPVQLLSDVVTDESGEPIAVVTTCEDISQRQRLEERLRQSQKMEAIGQLAGGIAHDFNNLLVVIQGHADFALQRLTEDDQNHPHLKQVREASQRAAALTRQLLAFSRRQVLEPIDLSLNVVVSQVLKILRRLLGEDIELRFRPADDLAIVHADPGQLEQVLMNLCVNARDALPEGGPIDIETANVFVDEAFCTSRPWARSGRYVRLTVRDQGLGMGKATLGQIFEPFFTTKDVGSGTGLGLATVYGIVKQHRGMIDVWSAPQQGSRFEVYLPIASAPTITPASPESPSTRGGDETILVAEDDDMVRGVVVHIFQRAGYRVLTAENGHQAVELVKRHPQDIDLVFLDLVMPVMGGAAAKAKIRPLCPDLPILFSTGYSSRKGQSLPDSHLPIILKPYQHHDLLLKVRQLLDTRHKTPSATA